jgi:hypothetical protein
LPSVSEPNPSRAWYFTPLFQLHLSLLPTQNPLWQLQAHTRYSPLFFAPRGRVGWVAAGWVASWPGVCHVYRCQPVSIGPGPNDVRVRNHVASSPALLKIRATRMTKPESDGKLTESERCMLQHGCCEPQYIGPHAKSTSTREPPKAPKKRIHSCDYRRSRCTSRSPPGAQGTERGAWMREEAKKKTERENSTFEDEHPNYIWEP